MTTIALDRDTVPLGRRLVLSGTLLVAAIVGCLAVAIANSTWFGVLNSFVGATEALPRGLLYSSWLLLIGGPIVAMRPASFGFRLGDLRTHVRLVVVVVLGSVAATVLLLRLIGATPYSEASLFIEVVDVPVTEELVFRAVLLTALLAGFARLWPAHTAVALAIGVDAIAFGVGHLANFGVNPSAFTIGQAVFATVLGALCGFLMVRTRTVYSAILLHGAVNAAVVLGS
jgi:membrane protease YdiL (CAAX protease family)